VDDWVDVEDLGMDNNTHPKDVYPVEMAMAMALGDHDKQVIAYDCGKPTDLQAYDIGERNHWCDLNPLMDITNTDITLTNVSYVLLQKVPRVRIKIRTCKIVQTVVPLFVGTTIIRRL
jgi:hypothetical protein